MNLLLKSEELVLLRMKTINFYQIALRDLGIGSTLFHNDVCLVLIGKEFLLVPNQYTKINEEILILNFLEQDLCDQEHITIMKYHLLANKSVAYFIGDEYDYKLIMA